MKTFSLAARPALPFFMAVTLLSASVWAQDNLARTGTAVQSSDWGAGQFPASLANDGNLGNFTATATADDMATWEVDLGAPAEIERIVVYNRGGGCCQSRLRDITVSIREFSLLEDPFGDEDPLASVRTTRNVYRAASSDYLLWRPVRGNSHLDLTMGHDIRQICYDVKNLMSWALDHQGGSRPRRAGTAGRRRGSGA